jgi:hypothetical protein
MLFWMSIVSPDCHAMKKMSRAGAEIVLTNAPVANENVINFGRKKFRHQPSDVSNAEDVDNLITKSMEHLLWIRFYSSLGGYEFNVRKNKHYTRLIMDSTKKKLWYFIHEFA